MILIFISWLYIALTSINLGFIFRKVFKIDSCNFIIHQILGLFLYTILTTLAAFLIRINIEYYTFILIVNIGLTFIFRKPISNEVKSILHRFKTFNINCKALYISLFLLALIQSTTKPYLIDNESYYIQTIKWINEFGYVKGLANLHLFLGQNSAWHALQAGFNFSFISNIFNDINGFVFAILGFLFVQKLNDSYNKQYYPLGLILIFTLFFMQFINAPSPDLITFLLAPYLIYEFFSNYSNISISKFNTLISIVLFLCFIKVTMIVFAILILFLFVKNFKILKVNTISYTFLCTLVLSLFLFKNYIISGYLLYPMNTFDVLSVDWKLPQQLLKLYKIGTYQSGMDNMDISQFNFSQKLSYWLQIPKLHGLFNKTYLILLIIFPFLIFKSKIRKPYTIIYILALLQFVLIWLNSPQYRFFIVFIIILSLCIYNILFESNKAGLLLIYISLILSAIFIFIPIKLNHFTSNKFAMSLSNFELKNIVIPEGISKTKTTFSKENINGFEFNSPGENAFFWGTGNGELPCVNKKQINYIKSRYHFIPQLRTEYLKDGFISKKTKNK